MLAIISILTVLSFAVFYPLCFLIHARSPIKSGFHRFHLGLPLVIGGVVLVSLLAGPFSKETKCFSGIWFILLAGWTFFYWKKESAGLSAGLIPPLLGLLAFAKTESELLHIPTLDSRVLISILGGSVLCASLHAMMLGHHYLNAKGLPMKHLRWANAVLWSLLGLRILWDSYFLFYGKLMYAGDRIALIHFLMRLEGFLLWIGIFFGTLFPFIALFFVREILKLKNTQAATGLLYVVLCSVLMGDLAYKYYLVKYGVAL